MERFIGMELRAIDNLMKRKYQATSFVLECDRMTGMHGYVLGYLFHIGKTKDIFQRDIEQKFEIRRSTATEMLKLMESNGLIERVSVDYDARLKKIVLTKKAEEFHKKVMNEVHALDAQLRVDVSTEELNTFFATLDKIKMNLQK